MERSPGADRWAYFLREETLHGLYSYLEDNPGWNSPDVRFHELSHGEGFLALLDQRVGSGGLYLLDEPDAALSFTGSLSLAPRLLELTRGGAQVLLATIPRCSPPSRARGWSRRGPWGLRPAEWADLELTAHWRQFLAAPEAFFRHL
ncbi:MAG: hypothetical protein ACR2KN_00095 [Geodermatophilaceae bacterium]